MTSVNKGELDLGDLADEKIGDEAEETGDEKLEGISPSVSEKCWTNG